MTKAETADLAEQIRRLVAATDDGSLIATAADRYRLEGALVALEVVLGDRPSLVDGLVLDS